MLSKPFPCWRLSRQNVGRVSTYPTLDDLLEISVEGPPLSSFKKMFNLTLTEWEPKQGLLTLSNQPLVIRQKKRVTRKSPPLSWMIMMTGSALTIKQWTTNHSAAVVFPCPFLSSLYSMFRNVSSTQCMYHLCIIKAVYHQFIISAMYHQYLSNVSSCLVLNKHYISFFLKT